LHLCGKFKRKSFTLIYLFDGSDPFHFQGKGRSSSSDINGAVFLKRFPRFEDLSCSDEKRSGKNFDNENSTALLTIQGSFLTLRKVVFV